MSLKRKELIVCIFIVIFSAISLFSCYLFYEFVDVSCVDHFWDFFNHNLISTSLGVFAPVLIGYIMWRIQNRSQKTTDYLEKYLSSIIEHTKIRQLQADVRKELAKSNIKIKKQKWLDEKSDNLDVQERSVGAMVTMYRNILINLKVFNMSKFDELDDIYIELNTEFDLLSKSEANNFWGKLQEFYRKYKEILEGSSIIM